MISGESQSAWSVVRQRNFLPYFIGNAASASGTWFQNLAASVLVYRLTQSALMLAPMAVATLIMAPIVGRLTDRARTRQRVAYFGAGVGVTPLRALAEGAPYAWGDAVLFQRYTHTPIFRRELGALAG